MHDVYKKIDEYNLYKENKILIVFDDMIADMTVCFCHVTYAFSE